MTTAIGIIVITVGLLVFIGQALSFFAPDLATKTGLNSPEEDMDKTLYIIETKAQRTQRYSTDLDVSVIRLVDDSRSSFLAIFGFSGKRCVLVFRLSDNLLSLFSAKTGYKSR